MYVNDIQQLEVKSMFQQGVIKLFFIADQPVIHVLPVITAWNPLSWTKIFLQFSPNG